MSKRVLTVELDDPGDALINTPDQAVVEMYSDGLADSDGVAHNVTLTLVPRIPVDENHLIVRGLQLLQKELHRVLVVEGDPVLPPAAITAIRFDKDAVEALWGRLVRDRFENRF